MSKGTHYQTRARKVLYAAGAQKVFTTGGTGYAGGVDLLAFFPGRRCVALQIKACHRDRKGRNGAANAALRRGIAEIRAEPLPAWFGREVWVFRRGGVVKRIVDRGTETPP